MRLTPADPDIRTLVDRIRDGSLDLQPDFQRGLVWSRSKQQKLIDSILREWHVPPIHVIRDSEQNEEVLDGQQRLEAIRAFTNDEFPVAGLTDPIDLNIVALDGLTYSRLPPKSRKQFDRFAIRVFTIVDFAPEEPYELFYRLNQPTTLTSSEQRNAFFGKAREQVKSLVSYAMKSGLGRDTVGFSNSRMAYDDVIARVCFTLERKSLGIKITSSDITDSYRSSDGFSEAAVQRTRDAIELMFSIDAFTGELRLNKATFYSWLCFFAEASKQSPSHADRQIMSQFVIRFEYMRQIARLSEFSPHDKLVLPSSSRQETAALFRVYSDRSIARVADVSSVLLRDLILWLAFARVHSAARATFPRAARAWKLCPPTSLEDVETTLLEVAISSNWGDLQ